MEPASLHADRPTSGEWHRRLAYWAPILAPILGGAALIAGNLLGTVCTRRLPGENGCADYGLAPLGVGLSLAGLLGIVLGLYAIFAPRHETFAHTCASCGRHFQDSEPRGERRVAGQIACSIACEDKLASIFHAEEMKAKIAALEAAAKQQENAVVRERALQRLQEMVAEASEPYRGLAKDALERTEGR